MQREHLQLLRQRRIGAGDHPAFRGGHIFGGIKTEDGGIADAADHAAAILRADGMRGVLQHEQVMPARDIQNIRHRAGMAGEMHRNDGARARGNCRFDAAGSILCVSGVISTNTGFAP